MGSLGDGDDMSEVPATVENALADVPVAGRRCLEAGAGAGNATAGLQDAGAATVVAVTRDRDHASDVHDRFEETPEVTAVRADLRSIPLADDAVEVVTAHALFNVVAPEAVEPIVRELTRVAAPGAWLVVDDYAPLPPGPVRELFALEDATAALADARSAYTFYPAAHLRALFADAGWHHERTRDLLDPVPWTPALLDAHADLVAERAASLRDDLASGLVERTDAVRERAGDGVETGRMYSMALRLTA
jgi:SAM-dependent methyltransferase